MTNIVMQTYLWFSINFQFKKICNNTKHAFKYNDMWSLVHNANICSVIKQWGTTFHQEALSAHQ